MGLHPTLPHTEPGSTFIWDIFSPIRECLLFYGIRLSSNLSLLVPFSKSLFADDSVLHGDSSSE